jgi:DNA-binding CsgD family transcriptional regulator
MTDSFVSTRAKLALDAIERLGSGDAPAQQIVEEIARRVVGVIDADAFFVGAIDPATGQCLGAAVHNLAEHACHPYWEHELMVPDYNKFGDLTAAEPVGDLRRATGGKLARSARYRAMNAVADLEDELRAVLHAGGRAWGNLQLNRRTGATPFSDADRAFLAAAAPLAGAALRRSLLDEPATSEPSRGPGVVVLDAAGAVVNTTAEADAWLDELAVGYREHPTYIGIRPELLLMPLSGRSEADQAARRVRLRTLDGTWLVAHGSPLAGSDQIVIVIEPARAAEIAPIVIKACGLTARETEVTQLVARGLSTDRIASTLFLSRHTIRDHLKAIFEKVGVTSRGELTSKLFATLDHVPMTAGAP